MKRGWKVVNVLGLDVLCSRNRRVPATGWYKSAITHRSILRRNIGPRTDIDMPLEWGIYDGPCHAFTPDLFLLMTL